MKISFQRHCITSIACLALIAAACGAEPEDAAHGNLQRPLGVNNLTVVALLSPGQVGIRINWTGDTPQHSYVYHVQRSNTGAGGIGPDVTVYENNYPQNPPTQTNWSVPVIRTGPSRPIECGQSYTVQVFVPNTHEGWYTATGDSTPCNLKPGTLALLRHVNDDQCLFPASDTVMSHWGCWGDPNMVYYVEDMGFGNARLRHQLTNTCIANNAQDGGQVPNGSCQSGSALYTLIDAGSGFVRLKNFTTGKSLYTAWGNGGTLHSWVSWPDPNMSFSLDPP